MTEARSSEVNSCTQHTLKHCSKVDPATVVWTVTLDKLCYAWRVGNHFAYWLHIQIHHTQTSASTRQLVNPHLLAWASAWSFWYSCQRQILSAAHEKLMWDMSQGLLLGQGIMPPKAIASQFYQSLLTRRYCSKAPVCFGRRYSPSEMCAACCRKAESWLPTIQVSMTMPCLCRHIQLCLV